MEIKKAKECAWRGVYLFNNRRGQIARVVVDPHNGVKPALDVKVFRWEFRVTLPWVSWARACKGKVWMALYKLSQSFWHGMDGRYGWGTTYRKTHR